MQAGFASANITPSAGCVIEGFGQGRVCTGVHDELFLRALFLDDASCRLLIVAADLLFLDRRTVTRLKDSLRGTTGLACEEVLINTTHTHAGPRVTNWAYGDAPDPAYMDLLCSVLAQTAAAAMADQREVRLFAGCAKTDLPVSRRLVGADGKAGFRPAFDGPVFQCVPICIVSDRLGGVVSALFSASCHPSMWYETTISADYPGVAQSLINRHFHTDGAMFLQGAGGDAKPREAAGETDWRRCSWEDIEAAGAGLAASVIARVDRGLAPVRPSVRTRIGEITWPLEPAPSYSWFKAAKDDASADCAQRRWAVEMLARLDAEGRLPTHVPIGIHAAQMGNGVRLIGLEGEPVSELGFLIRTLYDRGVTFPLGYTNGAQLYLPVSRMRGEGGYEIESFWEYHWPSALSGGGEQLIEDWLRGIRDLGAIPNDGDIQGDPA